MNQWIQNYANRFHINVCIFVISGAITITLAILTVIWQSWNTANRNPVEALKDE